MSSKNQIGRDGEDEACAFLTGKNYQIVERNFRTRSGEIDIIAIDKEFLVFVEVKRLLHGDVDVLSHEVDSRKQEKIIKTAKIYLEKHREYNSKFIRFGVLAVDVPGLEPVHHITNAFTE